jgi:hypothetical protein
MMISSIADCVQRHFENACWPGAALEATRTTEEEEEEEEEDNTSTTGTGREGGGAGTRPRERHASTLLVGEASFEATSFEAEEELLTIAGGLSAG